MHSRYRHEFGSAGLDDFLQTLGDGHGTGLRIPAAAVGSQSGLPIDYLFLLHAVDLLPGDELRGVAQLLTVAAPQATTPAPPAEPVTYPFENVVRTSTWHAPDSYQQWILTYENTPPTGAQRNGPLDSDSFVFEDCQSPALVYETAHFPAVPPAPGYLGLDDYTPPAVKGSIVLVVRDLRWPWTDDQSFPSLRIAVHTNTRFRFYLRIRQTSAATRPLLPIDATAWAKFPDCFAPEDGMLVASQTLLGADTFQYWRCAGRILYQSGKYVRRFEPGEAAAAPEC
jgi:hypothetical protein